MITKYFGHGTHFYYHFYHFSKISKENKNVQNILHVKLSSQKCLRKNAFSQAMSKKMSKKMVGNKNFWTLFFES